jgi:hypothetical protein
MEDYRNRFCIINQKNTETEDEVRKDETLELKGGGGSISLRVWDISDSKLAPEINSPGFLITT